MKTVTLYSDYVCPYCLLAEQVLSQVVGDQDITIKWRAFELRPAPVPTLRPEDSYLPTVWENSVYPLAEKLGVEIRLPSQSPQPRTAKAFELLAMAQDHGVEHAYSMRVLRAFFQEDLDIGDPDVLSELAAEVGLDRVAAEEALKNGTYRDRHLEALRHAHEDMAISSVPTLVVGDRVFRGVPAIDDLRTAINQLEDHVD